MIISHKHRFIFIRVPKTASTSLEIALSRFCGEKDILTTLAPRDNQMRASLGYPGVQNQFVPLRHYTKIDFLRLLYHRKRIEYRRHMPASVIRSLVDEEIWKNYFKFCVVRNPWDRAVSFYYFKGHKKWSTISEYLHSQKFGGLPDFDYYTERSELLVDRVFFYEKLDEAVAELQEILQLPQPLELPRTKTHFRTDRSHYRQLLSPRDRDRVAQVLFLILFHRRFLNIYCGGCGVHSHIGTSGGIALEDGVIRERAREVRRRGVAGAR